MDNRQLRRRPKKTESLPQAIVGKKGVQNKILPATSAIRRSSRVQPASILNVSAKELGENIKTPINATVVQKKEPVITKRAIVSIKSIKQPLIKNLSGNAKQNDSEKKSLINPILNSELVKVAEYVRRSVSKTFSNHSLRQSHTPTTTDHSRISRSISRSIYDYYDDFEDDNYSKAEFSDNEDEIDRNKISNLTKEQDIIASTKCRLLPDPKEFGGYWGICFLILSIPSFVIYILCCCTKTACKLETFDLIKLLNFNFINKIFLLNVVGIYLGFLITISFLSAIMLGRYEKLPTDRIECKRHFNVLSLGLLTTIGFFIAEFYNFEVANYITQYYLHFCIYGIINALIVAFWCYIRASYTTINVKANPYGKTQSSIINYSLGKQINPKWFGIVEIKQIYYRISLLSSLLLALIYIYKSIQFRSVKEDNILFIEGFKTFSDIKLFFNNIQIRSTTFMSSFMLFFYVFDSILFEHHLVSSFELQHEGVGAFLLLRYAVVPFLISSVTKYTYEHGPFTLPTWFCYLNLIIFFTGLFIKRLSNYVKYRYRINPSDQRFDGIETIHTFEGRRLLVDWFWGSVRQPNYAGDIVALIGISLPLVTKFAWPPMICILLLILMLMHRATRVSSRNASRYHSSWVRYTSKVRHFIIPGIY